MHKLGKKNSISVARTSGSDKFRYPPSLPAVQLSLPSCDQARPWYFSWGGLTHAAWCRTWPVLPAQGTRTGWGISGKTAKAHWFLPLTSPSCHHLPVLVQCKVPVKEIIKFTSCVTCFQQSQALLLPLEKVLQGDFIRSVVQFPGQPFLGEIHSKYGRYREELPGLIGCE